MTIQIRPETTDDIDAITALHRAAFGDEEVPELVHALRQGKETLQTQSFVAQIDGAVVGHVMISHSWLDAPKRMVDVLVLGPLGVQPAHQRQGVGKALLAHAAQAAEAAGAPLLFLEGNPKYYKPRGYLKASEHGFRRPSLRIPDAAFQVIKLSAYDPDEMTGTFVYRDVFWALDCVGLRKDT